MGGREGEGGGLLLVQGTFFERKTQFCEPHTRPRLSLPCAWWCQGWAGGREREPRQRSREREFFFFAGFYTPPLTPPSQPARTPSGSPASTGRPPGRRPGRPCRPRKRGTRFYRGRPRIPGRPRPCGGRSEWRARRRRRSGRRAGREWRNGRARSPCPRPCPGRPCRRGWARCRRRLRGWWLAVEAGRRAWGVGGRATGRRVGAAGVGVGTGSGRLCEEEGGGGCAAPRR